MAGSAREIATAENNYFKVGKYAKYVICFSMGAVKIAHTIARSNGTTTRLTNLKNLKARVSIEVKHKLYPL